MPCPHPELWDPPKTSHPFLAVPGALREHRPGPSAPTLTGHDGLVLHGVDHGGLLPALLLLGGVHERAGSSAPAPPPARLHGNTAGGWTGRAGPGRGSVPPPLPSPPPPPPTPFPASPQRRSGGEGGRERLIRFLDHRARHYRFRGAPPPPPGEPEKGR